jgi:uncharacterized protein YbjT (DUF2867 family)
MILVTGASGTVGQAVLEALGPRPDVLAATRGEAGPGQRRFDWTCPDGYAAAVEGVTSLFLLLPPGLQAARERFGALLSAARSAGVQRAIFLSIRNADRLTVLPHRGIEQVIEQSGLAWTHLRPNDFMQNFATQPVYRDGIREGELWAAGGRSRTSYVDVRDVGEAAALVLTRPGHDGHAYPLTGPENLTLDHVAQALSHALGRMVVNKRPSLPGFILHARRQGAALPLALVMASIGLVARLGYAKGVDPELERLLGRAPRSFASFAADYQDVWIRGGGISPGQLRTIPDSASGACPSPSDHGRCRARHVAARAEPGGRL